MNLKDLFLNYDCWPHSHDELQAVSFAHGKPQTRPLDAFSFSPRVLGSLFIVQ